MAKRRYHGDMLVGVSKTMEDGDGDMIRSDFKAPYNMPKEVKMMDYPKVDYAAYPEYPDTYADKDGEMDSAVRKVKSEATRRY